MRPFLYRLGRFLQLAGMIMLPLAIVGNLSPEAPLSLGTSLAWSGVGVGIFALGWMIQQVGRPE